jgi:hypothetical protein
VNHILGMEILTGVKLSLAITNGDPVGAVDAPDLMRFIQGP